MRTVGARLAPLARVARKHHEPYNPAYLDLFAQLVATTSATVDQPRCCQALPDTP